MCDGTLRVRCHAMSAMANYLKAGLQADDASNWIEKQVFDNFLRDSLKQLFQSTMVVFKNQDNLLVKINACYVMLGLSGFGKYYYTTDPANPHNFFNDSVMDEI